MDIRSRSDAIFGSRLNHCKAIGQCQSMLSDSKIAQLWVSKRSFILTAALAILLGMESDIPVNRLVSPKNGADLFDRFLPVIAKFMETHHWDGSPRHERQSQATSVCMYIVSSKPAPAFLSKGGRKNSFSVTPFSSAHWVNLGEDVRGGMLEFTHWLCSQHHERKDYFVA